MNLKEYSNNWHKIERRCDWITISDFMPVKDITERSIATSIRLKNNPTSGMFKKGHKTNIGRKPWHKGKTGVFSQETLKKMSLSHKGNKSRTGMTNSEEHRKNNSIRFTGSGNPFYGKHHTHEEVAKMRLRKASLETRRKIGLKSRGRKWSDENRKKKSIEMFEKRKNWKIPYKDTKPEKMMQLALQLQGVIFEKHKPFKIGRSWHQVDIFIEPNIIVEVDGVHWHLKPENIRRDLLQSQELTVMGYHVIRIRDKDILKNSKNCAEIVKNLILDLRKIILR